MHAIAASIPCARRYRTGLIDHRRSCSPLEEHDCCNEMVAIRMAFGRRPGGVAFPAVAEPRAGHIPSAAASSGTDIVGRTQYNKVSTRSTIVRWSARTDETPSMRRVVVDEAVGLVGAGRHQVIGSSSRRAERPHDRCPPHVKCPDPHSWTEFNDHNHSCQYIRVHRCASQGRACAPSWTVFGAGTGRKGTVLVLRRTETDPRGGRCA